MREARSIGKNICRSGTIFSQIIFTQSSITEFSRPYVVGSGDLAAAPRPPDDLLKTAQRRLRTARSRGMRNDGRASNGNCTLRLFVLARKDIIAVAAVIDVAINGSALIDSFQAIDAMVRARFQGLNAIRSFCIAVSRLLAGDRETCRLRQRPLGNRCAGSSTRSTPCQQVPARIQESGSLADELAMAARTRRPWLPGAVVAGARFVHSRQSSETDDQPLGFVFILPRVNAR